MGARPVPADLSWDRHHPCYPGYRVCPVWFNGRIQRGFDLVWFFSTLLLIAALLLVVSPACLESGCLRHTRYSPFLTITAGILFLVSCMLQYGISLYGPAGFSLPFGVPVLMVIGYWTYRLDEGEELVICTETHQDGD